jgi:hypothetical protein
MTAMVTTKHRYLLPKKSKYETKRVVVIELTTNQKLIFTILWYCR